tara:strand:+ start:7885 stop:8289 length:405 start_codon:yes stop_codon:yes gene_type:complete
MDNFYLIVITIAILLLIVILTYLGIIMNNQKNVAVNFPTTEPQTCPDYWKTSENEDKKTVCVVPDVDEVNIGDLLTTTENEKTHLENTVGYNDKDNIKSIDFNDENEWSVCNKKEWTLKHKVFWNGVAEYSKGC